ncbi:MAG: cobalamin-dependent protein [Deltaproteobacteria bacterium]|nr:cobalamin-dependent protein [Deltaproteobacteria bacterium]
MSEKLVDAMSNMREKEALEIAKTLVDADENPVKILDYCSKAMEKVGSCFEAGEYFLPELMMAGEMVRQISEMVKPKLKGKVTSEKRGRVLMGTVEGDIHDIGKDIVSFLLDVNAFEVRDIGIDVPPGKFVEEIKEFQPQVVGMSGLLTLAYDSMKNTVQAIEEAGLRDSVKIMIGGGQMNEEVREYAGADAFGKDAMEGVTLAKKWVLGE